MFFKTKSLVPPLRLLFLMWLSFYLQKSMAVDFGFLGVLPRDPIGLIGIVTAPLVHGNLAHIISNSFPLLILGSALFLFYPIVAGLVFLICYFVPSIFVWIFARDFYHIGASGLVYALGFFLIFLGLVRRDNKSILISIFVMLVYGSILFNASMLSAAVSWESHVFGAVTGIGTAISIQRTYGTPG